MDKFATWVFMFLIFVVQWDNAICKKICPKFLHKMVEYFFLSNNQYNSSLWMEDGKS